MKKLGIVLSLLAAPVMAGQFEDMTAEGHAFGSAQQGYLQGFANGQDARAAQYGGNGAVTEDISPCNQRDANGVRTCGGQVVNDADNPQQYYGKTQVQLEDEARVRATMDENAQFVMGAHSTRPSYDVRPNDPLFKHQEANENNMVSLTDTYTGCKDIAYGGTVASTQDATCRKTGTATYQDTTCHRSLSVACSNADANQPQPFTAADFTVTGPALSKSVSGNTVTFSASRGANCNGYDSYVTFNIQDTRYIGQFLITNVGWDDSFYMEINGTPIHMARGSLVGTSPMGAVNILNRCEYGAWFNSGNDRDLKPYLKNGTNTLRIFNRVGGSGGISVQLLATRFKKCQVADTFSETCDASFDRAKASLVSSTCTSGSATINLGYENATRSCWKWDDIYRWEGQPAYQEEALCQTLRDQGCTPNGSTCNTTSPSGWCQDATLAFTCTTESPENVMQICGDTLVCPDGKCYDAYKQPQDATQDFLKAASYLAAMDDMRKEFDPDNVTVWKGEFKECSVNKTLIGSDQCCQGGSGTINTLGKSCNQTEEQINQARTNKTVSFIRSWDECTQEVANVCVNKLTHYEFCLWPSKLARIVQDQGRPMLGQRVAAPCPGFRLQNPNEFEGIDWSQINFGDFYADVMSKYNATAKPNPSAVTNQVQQSQDALLNEYTQKMQQYYGK